MPDRNGTIKRLQDSLKVVNGWCCRTDSLDDPIMNVERAMEDALELLKEQEAVEPKTGHWIESKCLDECFWVCSECNFPSEAMAAPELYKYCPNCGTKMAERR